MLAAEVGNLQHPTSWETTVLSPATTDWTSGAHVVSLNARRPLEGWGAWVSPHLWGAPSSAQITSPCHPQFWAFCCSLVVAFTRKVIKGCFHETVLGFWFLKSNEPEGGVRTTRFCSNHSPNVGRLRALVTCDLNCWHLGWLCPSREVVCLHSAQSEWSETGRQSAGVRDSRIVEDRKRLGPLTAVRLSQAQTQRTTPYTQKRVV